MAKLKFLTIDGLLEMQANNEKFVLVEVLKEESYKEGHISGAINIPLEQLENSAKNKLNKNDVVVTYCASYPCQASTKAASLLMKIGFKKVFDFKGGKKAWEDSGFDLER